jgi:hypothetical protein
MKIQDPMEIRLTREKEYRVAVRVLQEQEIFNRLKVLIDKGQEEIVFLSCHQNMETPVMLLLVI